MSSKLVDIVEPIDEMDAYGDEIGEKEHDEHDAYGDENCCDKEHDEEVDVLGQRTINQNK